MERRCQKYSFQTVTFPVSAAGALKFNRTQGTKPHNINFHVFFVYAPGITCFVYLHGLSFDTRVSQRYRKLMDRRFQKYNFQTVVNSSFCCRDLEIP